MNTAAKFGTLLAVTALSVATFAQGTVLRVYAGSDNHVNVVYVNGKSTEVARERGQIGIDSIEVAEDGQTVGWVVLYRDPDGGSPIAGPKSGLGAAYYPVLQHHRGEVETLNGEKHIRASLWIEQEIAIAAFLVEVCRKNIPVALYIQKGNKREGIRDLLRMDPYYCTGFHSWNEGHAALGSQTKVQVRSAIA